MIVTLGELQPGDIIEATGEMVEGVQILGPVCIVDFTNHTATAPLPTNGQTKVLRQTERTGTWIN